MKKSGFTLSEVLISLAIIGVVAALTAPALIQDVSNSRVGPTLAKVKSSMENANRMIMEDHNTVDLRAAVSFDDGNGNVTYNNYINELTGHLRGTRALLDGNAVNGNADSPVNFGDPREQGATGYYDNESKLQLPNSVLVTFFPDPGVNYNNSSNSSGYRGPLAEIVVDIDGWDAGQNRLGFDMFCFIIDRNGGLIPEGSTAFATDATPSFQQNNHWSAGAGNDMACNADNVGTGEGCAGSIFENNQRVIYK